MSTRVAIVSKMPTPYRVSTYEAIASHPEIDLHVIYLSEREPNREWTVPPGSVSHEFLKERIWKIRGNYVHVNPAIWSRLKVIDPDVVITNGYNVSDLIAYLFTVTKRRQHISQTDGTIDSEATLSPFHRLVRSIVRRQTAAYIGPSDKSLDLFRSQGVPNDRVFKAPFVVDASRFASTRAKRFDMLFVGRLTAVKNPFFAIDVAAAVGRRLGRKVTMAVVGSGSDESIVRAHAAEQSSVDVTVTGFEQQDRLAHWYLESRLFLFPTLWDPWGVVANEAALAGLPIITTPHAGVAGELVQDGRNGRVLALDLAQWAEAAHDILESATTYSRMSEESTLLVSDHNLEAAAGGYIAAIARAVASRSS